MKKEDLFEAIGELDSNIPQVKKSMPVWLKVTAAAACFAFVIAGIRIADSFNTAGRPTTTATNAMITMESKEEQGNPKQQDDGFAACDPEGGVDSHHPDGDCGFVEQFITADEDDGGKEQRGCGWQNDLAPRSDSFHTGEQVDAGHCRADHAKRHQPGQHIFTADINMYSFIHNNCILTNNNSLRKV